jgi:hypothetical protein
MTTFSCITPYSYQLLQQAGFTTNEIGEVLEPCASSYDYKPFLDSFSWPPGFIKTMEDSELLSGVGRVFAKAYFSFLMLNFKSKKRKLREWKRFKSFEHPLVKWSPKNDANLPPNC